MKWSPVDGPLTGSIQPTVGRSLGNVRFVLNIPPTTRRRSCRWRRPSGRQRRPASSRSRSRHWPTGSDYPVRDRGSSTTASAVKRVRRVMRENGLRGVRKGRFVPRTTDERPSAHHRPPRPGEALWRRDRRPGPNERHHGPSPSRRRTVPGGDHRLEDASGARLQSPGIVGPTS